MNLALIIYLCGIALIFCVVGALVWNAWQECMQFNSWSYCMVALR